MIRYISKEERDMAQSILIVDDERDIVSMLNQYFCKIGYVVYTAINGKEALNAITKHPDIILLDLGLPDMDGIDVISEIRKWAVTPIIVISARNSESEKVKALDAGADDYITKPFGNQELLARIRTALRHRRQPMETETKTPMYHADQLKIDFDKRRVFLGEEEVRLTQIEYKLVSLLAENAGKVITYESIIKDIWGPHADTNNRILRVNMANIRRKIEKNPAVPKYVFTEVGVGYRMLENELNS